MGISDLVAGDHRLDVKVGGERRHFQVHVPKERTRRHPVVAFDGVQLFNQEGNMGAINGLNEASETYGFAAIYPIPRTRYFGILAGWNTSGGFLAYDKRYDDIDYVGEIFRLLDVEKAYVVGFSEGAQFAHILAGRLPGTIAGVVSVSGTWLGTEPSPAPGTAAWIVHGENDPALPYEGGCGSTKVRLLARLGNPNMWLSRPRIQAGAYAAANGYSSVPSREEEAEDRTYVKRSFGPAGGVPVVEYFVRSPWGGHTYHGRRTGEGTESILSRGHGRPLSAAAFSINDTIIGMIEGPRVSQTH